VNHGSSPRILAIRGGSIGDFVLTLPALRLLREGLPDCAIDLLGYRHIAELARGRYYASEVRSIEYGPLASFFSRRPTLSEEMIDYFAGYQQVVSWLFDPDHIFETNLRSIGVKNYINAWRRITPDGPHAVRQWASPLESLALYLEDSPAAEGARLFPSIEDHQQAAQLRRTTRPYVVFHPGSGSPSKNWPVEHWALLIPRWLDRNPEHDLIIVCGEADGAVHEALRRHSLEADWRLEKIQFLEHTPLATLAALIQNAMAYVGHDTGCSHIAAATGTPSLILFGPTDPNLWGPRNPNACILRAQEGDLAALEVGDVLKALEALPSRFQL
jgi:heptosyltransferase-2